MSHTGGTIRSNKNKTSENGKTRGSEIWSQGWTCKTMTVGVDRDKEGIVCWMES